MIGTSSYLREFSHGKDLCYINNQETKVVNFIKALGSEVGLSSEDSFRSDLADFLNVRRHVSTRFVRNVRPHFR